MQPIIKVENLGKSYIIGHQRESYVALRDVLTNKVRQVASKTKNLLSGGQLIAGNELEEFWALKDINFEVQQGDRVGIIGRNGAGKSTLLKVLSRITEPTTGSIRLRGRVASLLEVGTGFHPELSGRENIYLNGAILGMSRAEVKKKFDEIVDFAGVEKFLDTPVKRYSSGMYVRLAFAVAAHLEPEILIVDEVLAVGDAEFQKKCLGKMEDVSKNHGRTVLFVSHNMGAIEQLTQKTLLLQNGTVFKSGDTSSVVSAYLNTNNTESAIKYNLENSPRKYLGTLSAKFIELRFLKDTPHFNFNEDFQFISRVKVFENLKDVRISMTIFSNDGAPIGSCFSKIIGDLSVTSNAEIKVTLPNPSLAPGNYYCGISIGTGDYKTSIIDFDVVLDTLHFEVRPEESGDATIAHWTKGWGSIIFQNLNAEIISKIKIK